MTVTYGFANDDNGGPFALWDSLLGSALDIAVGNGAILAVPGAVDGLVSETSATTVSQQPFTAVMAGQVLNLAGVRSYLVADNTSGASRYDALSAVQDSSSGAISLAYHTGTATAYVAGPGELVFATIAVPTHASGSAAGTPTVTDTRVFAPRKVQVASYAGWRPGSPRTGELLVDGGTLLIYSGSAWNLCSSNVTGGSGGGSGSGGVITGGSTTVSGGTTTITGGTTTITGGSTSGGGSGGTSVNPSQVTLLPATASSSTGGVDVYPALSVDSNDNVGGWTVVGGTRAKVPLTGMYDYKLMLEISQSGGSTATFAYGLNIGYAIATGQKAMGGQSTVTATLAGTVYLTAGNGVAVYFNPSVTGVEVVGANRAVSQLSLNYRHA